MYVFIIFTFANAKIKKYSLGMPFPPSIRGIRPNTTVLLALRADSRRREMF